MSLDTPFWNVLEQQDSISFLVAEDNAVNQRRISRLLEKRGHRIVVAQRSFDVVLMDGQMPEMDGFEATKRIREAEKAGGNHLPITSRSPRTPCRETSNDSWLAAWTATSQNPSNWKSVIANVIRNIHRGAEAKDLLPSSM